MASTSTLYSHQDSVIDKVTNLVPIGHKKFFKQALYITAALIFFGLVVIVFGYAYFVLELFIKPLLWAMLCGSFLFPFKHALQSAIDSWLMHTWDKKIPLIVNASVMPLVIFSNFSDWLGSIIKERWKVISAFIGCLITLYFINFIGLLTSIMVVTSVLLNWCYYFLYYISIFTHNYSGLTLVCLGIYFCVTLSMKLSISKYIAIALWSFGFTYITGMFQIPLAMLILILYIIGIANKNGADGTSSDINMPRPSSYMSASPSSSSNLERFSKSAKYFNMLFVVYAIVVTWFNIWLLLLMLIPLTFWICKIIVFHAKTSEIIDKICYKCLQRSKLDLMLDIKNLCVKHQHIIFPEPLPNVVIKLRRGDMFIHSCIISYLPAITSVLIIIIIFFTVISLSIFVIANIQQEAYLVVKISSDLINQTVNQNPEYKTWFPDNDTLHNSMDSLVDVVYLKGRDWLSRKIQTAMGSEVNSAKVKHQVLKLWDEFYVASFMQVSRNVSIRNPSSVGKTNLFANLIDLLNMTEVLSWLHDHLSSLMSLGESVLMMLQSNINLIFSICTTIFTILLTGGTIVLNFLVSLVVFFTALFYLLSSSKDQYKPLEFLRIVIEPKAGGTQVGDAIEDAVNGVFGASIKMFCFYGLYTWVNHCIFCSNLSYIPAILAAIFSVVPVLTTYWVSFPTALEIWIIQGSLFRAIGLVTCQILPTLFVDTAIYYDMTKNDGGVHPYVTGLAVAGGFYSFGLQGAVTGPLILCLLLVTFNLYTKATLSAVEEKNE